MRKKMHLLDFETTHNELWWVTVIANITFVCLSENSAGYLLTYSISIHVPVSPRVSRGNFWFIVTCFLLVNHYWRDAREMSNTNCIIHGLRFRMQLGSRCLSPWNDSYLICFECKNDFPVSVVNLKSAVKHGDASVRLCHGNSGLQTGKEN